jgi:hypothetical protein
MTEAEALALKPGQAVETILRGKITRVEVCRVYDDRARFGGLGPVTVVCRRPSLDAMGRRRQALPRRPEELRRCADLDRFTANAFADWLEERGEHRAAAMLREAFPFVAADGGVTAREAAAT